MHPGFVSDWLVWRMEGMPGKFDQETKDRVIRLVEDRVAA